MRIAALMMLSLTACAPVTAEQPAMAEPPVMAEPMETCRRDALAQFTGQPATQELGARILAASGARNLRWVARGMMVTMDYRGDRVTVHLDLANRVERASCG